MRGGLALALAISIAPAVHIASLGNNAAALVVALAAEFLCGAAIGMGASLVYDAAYAGGRVVDDYVGVRAIAPNRSSSRRAASAASGRWYSRARFFLSGGYRIALLGFAQSFERMPPGTGPSAEAWSAYAAHFAATIVLAALEVAAPAVALAFLVQVALGALSRVIPRFGSFTLTFPLAFAAALAATAIVAPLFVTRVPAPLTIAP